MAREKPVFNHGFEAGTAMSVPFNLPGGRNLFYRILGWGTALFLIIYAAFGRKFFAAYKDFLIASLELDDSTPDPEAAMALVGQMGSFFSSMVLVSLLAWVVMAMMETAMHKNVFHGTDHGAFPMRFGKDEARVMLAQFVLFICMIGVYFLTILGVILIFTLAAVLGSISTALGIIAGIAAFIGMIVLLGYLIHVCLRWAPAAAMSVRDNKQRIFEGWTITKGRGWSLFGSYLVVGILGYVLIYVIMFLGLYLAFGDMQAIAALSGLNVEDPTVLFDRMGAMLKTPRVMATLVIFTIMYMLVAMTWYMCFWGIGNYAAQLDAKEKGLM